ncbi:Uncharacterised protein [Serratia entomophila]|uniref:hypothetical protein n=1 Tax=Serratia entomophila TaxID=42906 RepID=UPI002179EDAE|nr:hypothetical protein [Serratia entomophila]CAI1205849.1 Uncharacterised protein [Serratia entomophila]CAI2147301.1 Uncharacterised protein [Serratia entomophila]
MTQTLTTEQLRVRAESLGLDFVIEQRAGVWVKEWNTGVCVTANAQEVEMWLLLANREAQPVGFISEKHGPVLYGEHISLPVGTHFYTAPPAPAVPDFGALTKLIVGRLIDCGAAGDDSIADAETFVYNACRAAMLAADKPADHVWVKCGVCGFITHQHFDHCSVHCGEVMAAAPEYDILEDYRAEMLKRADFGGDGHDD